MTEIYFITDIENPSWAEFTDGKCTHVGFLHPKIKDAIMGMTREEVNAFFTQHNLMYQVAQKPVEVKN